MNRERHFILCGECSHYRNCVVQHSYCPPYALAIRWLEAGEHVETTESEECHWNIVAELKEKRGDYSDFCEECWYRAFGHKCAFRLGRDKFGYVEPAGCGALRYVYNNIPCGLSRKR